MTAQYPDLTNDILILMYVVNNGDDTALGPMADELEMSEREGIRLLGRGLRLIGDRRPLAPPHNPSGNGWRWVGTWADLQHDNWLEGTVFGRLSEGVYVESNIPGEPGSRDYPTRAVALLALAAALVEVM